MRYRDGRSDRGYFLGLGRGVVRVAILRARDQELEAVLPLAIVEAIHFVVDLNQAPLATLGLAAPRAPMPGKSVEVHCSNWTIKGTRIHNEEVGFFLVPADPRSNSARVFFPEGSPQLVETSDLPSPPVDPDEEDGFLDVRTGQLLASQDIDPQAVAEAHAMDLDPFAGSLRSASAPPPTVGAVPTPLPAIAWNPSSPGPLPGLPELPPFAALMPPTATPLLPGEVEALIGLSGLGTADLKRVPGGLAFWDDPWALRAQPAPTRGPTPAPAPAEPPRMAARVLRPSGDENEFDIDIESPIPSGGEPSFAFSQRRLLDEK